MAKNKWIGVDFDETLRRYDDTPIEPMVDRVKFWIQSGIEVRIITARVCQIDHQPGWIENNGGPNQEKFVQDWCELHIGYRLQVQWGKSPGMIELWDDKVVRVLANYGVRLSPSEVEPDHADD